MVPIWITGLLQKTSTILSVNNLLNLKPLTEINKGILMPEFTLLLMERYSNTIFIIRQNTKQQWNFNHACIRISDHPNMANDTPVKTERG